MARLRPFHLLDLEGEIRDQTLNRPMPVEALFDSALARAAPLTSHDAARYNRLVIRSFQCRETEGIWRGRRSRKLPENIQGTARRKLRMLNNAQSLVDLRVPPGNRLEALVGARAGQLSIRINDQWRLCFEWTKEGPAGVEIVDYHS